MKFFFPLILIIMLSYTMNATTYYVSTDNNASDNNNGIVAKYQGNKKGPFLTIQKAVDIAKGGDEIKILAGRYNENIIIRRKDNLTIAAYGDGKVIIDGSYSQSQVKWKFIKKQNTSLHKKEFDIYQLDIENVFKENDYTYVYLDNDKPLWRYSSEEVFNKQYASVKKGRGYYVENGKLYLSCYGTNPNKEKLFVSKAQHQLQTIKSDNINIDGGPKKQIIFKYGSRRTIVLNGARIEMSINRVQNIQVIHSKMGITINDLVGRVEVLSSRTYLFCK